MDIENPPLAAYKGSGFLELCKYVSFSEACRAESGIFTQREKIASFIGRQWWILFLTCC